jgi:polyisoprenoid-binding protein YceI
MSGVRLKAKALRLFVAAISAFAVTRGVGAQEPAAPPAHRLVYRLEVAGSTLRWELPSTFETVKGVVAVFRGTIEANPLPTGGWDVKSRIVVPAAAMQTGNRRRDGRMRGKILETARYPEIVFELRRFTGDLSRFRPGETFSVQVAGHLTVHGRTALIQLPVDVYVFEDRVEIAGSFPLHWKEYGMRDPSVGVIRVKEPMMVVFRLRAVPEKVAGTGPAGLHPPPPTPEGLPPNRFGDNHRFR